MLYGARKITSWHSILQPKKRLRFVLFWCALSLKQVGAFWVGGLNWEIQRKVLLKSKEGGGVIMVGKWEKQWSIQCRHVCIDWHNKWGINGAARDLLSLSSTLLLTYIISSTLWEKIRKGKSGGCQKHWWWERSRWSCFCCSLLPLWGLCNFFLLYL